MPNKEDPDFILRLQSTFRVEAAEHLQSITAALLEWEKSPADMSLPAIEGIYREAHSLKGAARAVDQSDVEAICQAVEEILSAWRQNAAKPSTEAFDAIHCALDAIRGVLQMTEGPKVHGTPTRDEALRRLGAIRTSPGRVHPARQPEAVPPSVSEPVSSRPTGGQEAQQPDDPGRHAAVDTVRIPVAKLDARLRQAEDLLIVKTSAHRHAASLADLQVRFEQWLHQWQKVSPYVRSTREAIERPTSGNDPGLGVAFRRLLDFLDWNCEYIRGIDNLLQTHRARATYDRDVTSRRLDDLLEESRKLLMLPFTRLSDLFPRIVRDLSRARGKEVDLVVQGSDVEIDKRILDEIKDPVIHILRNCIDHGIEAPDQRERIGKPRRAKIEVSLSTASGSKVEITFVDDGAGVDLQQVKASAVRLGLISESEAAEMPDAEALELIFQPEVSTSSSVDTISGRGLGMAIVRETVARLGGSISIESRPQVGTTLRVVLPLALATFQGLLVVSASRTFVVPVTNVERVLRIRADQIQTMENRETIAYHGRAISLVRLDAVLELPSAAPKGDAQTLSAVLLTAGGGEPIAFVVDDILHVEEVVVKPLARPLVRVRNIAGATVVASGRTVPVLNVPDLLRSAPACIGKTAAKPAPADPGSRRRPQKRILVVEDSITSRMLLKGILESAGYLVTTATDGVEAFMALREDRFDLVVSDVEMPRMNGFDLTARIRSDKRLSELPVILVTALESPEQRERGFDVGASAYIAKSSFEQSNLLDAVDRLL